MQSELNIFDHEMYDPAKRIAAHLREHQRILISCHMNPDADAVGSMLALAYGLERLGKRVALCNSSNIPDYVDWMTKPSKVHKTLRGLGFKPELAIVLDCGDERRLGDIKNEVLAYQSINIDHHIGNPNFGSVDNWVDTRMAATGQMVAAILYELRVPFNDKICEALYAAISSDTGCFCYDNTSEQILLLMAHLVNQGLNISAVRQRMDQNWTLGRMRLWATLIGSIELERDGSIAILTASLKQMAKFNATSEDLEGIVEYMRRLRGVLAVAMIREDNPKQCKASLRSTGPISVQAMVAPLGGGGHRNAAGALLSGDLATCKETILVSMCKWLDENAR